MEFIKIILNIMKSIIFVLGFVLFWFFGISQYLVYKVAYWTLMFNIQFFVVLVNVWLAFCWPLICFCFAWSCLLMSAMAFVLIVFVHFYVPFFFLDDVLAFFFCFYRNSSFFEEDLFFEVPQFDINVLKSRQEQNQIFLDNFFIEQNSSIG